MTAPQRPKAISEYAAVCLQALGATEYGRFISLGGAFGLAHYFEYRGTKDVDAWWAESATRAERAATIKVLEQALQPFGEVRQRAWGDVVSVELQIEHATAFSFQIADRSAALDLPVAGIWPGGIGVDSFQDLVASKMVALVERGAPRDFLDIYTLCRQGQCSITDCWTWWSSRQSLAGQNVDRSRAVLAIRTHLARLDQVRPLALIDDADQRKAASDLRTWFDQEFVGELSN
jgi:hypothetical protein